MKFEYEKIFQLSKDKTEYRLISKDGIKVIKGPDGKKFLLVSPKALTLLAKEAFRDISFLLRKKHQKQVASILDDKEASENDRFMAYCLLENSIISSNFSLPFCQDTGTAIVLGKKGQYVITDCNDEEFISKGIFETYTKENLRYSQVIPISMYQEKNSGNNLPAQIEIYATQGMEYEFLFIAKGGGSANKTFLYQETKALLNPDSLKKFIIEKISTLGTSACPPYHIAVVVGGTSAEFCLKTVKLASTGYLDGLPIKGKNGRAFRDKELEAWLLKETEKLGFGAQFGGKSFAHDIKVIRLSRHAASCPVGLGVSCSADRQAKAKINSSGIWLEKLERNPEKLLSKKIRAKYSSCNNCVSIDLNRPMKEILHDLSYLKIGNRIYLNGKIIVARDAAHAKFKSIIDSGGKLPEYLLAHPIYYAGPAKTPKGMPSGSFGPTTAGRMDAYVNELQERGASMVMIAKGNRSSIVAKSCKKHGGFYLGSPGGPAAFLAKYNIKSAKAIDYPELGMEAVWEIEVENFPVFLLINDKGEDFFENIKKKTQ